MRKLLLINILSIFFVYLLFAPTALAANTTIEISPKNGSFDDLLKVDLVIDGHGDVFNAAESNVNLSSNLTVKNLTLGDCNFSYLNTPSSENLSFSGVILSDSSKKCTVYSMTLIPTAKGKATITLSKASVKRYGDAAEILKSVGNASFTLTGVATSQEIKGIKIQANDLHTVNINVVAKENEPLSGASIILTSPDKKSTLEAKTSHEGKAQFTNVKEGIYQATVKKDTKEVAKTILNVKGINHTISLGINLENQKNNPLMKNNNSIINNVLNSPFLLAGMLFLGVVVGIALPLVFNRLKSKKE